MTSRRDPIRITQALDEDVSRRSPRLRAARRPGSIEAPGDEFGIAPRGRGDR